MIPQITALDLIRKIQRMTEEEFLQDLKAEHGRFNRKAAKTLYAKTKTAEIPEDPTEEDIQWMHAGGYPDFMKPYFLPMGTAEQRVFYNYLDAHGGQLTYQTGNGKLVDEVLAIIPAKVNKDFIFRRWLLEQTDLQEKSMPAMAKTPVTRNGLIGPTTNELGQADLAYVIEWLINARLLEVWEYMGELGKPLGVRAEAIAYMQENVASAYFGNPEAGENPAIVTLRECLDCMNGAQEEIFWDLLEMAMVPMDIIREREKWKANRQEEAYRLIAALPEDEFRFMTETYIPGLREDIWAIKPDALEATSVQTAATAQLTERKEA